MSSFSYCYMHNGEELTSANKSEEHIIQQSIGGHEYSTELVCHNINNGIFKKFDNALKDALQYFINSIDFKRERRSKKKDKKFIYGENKKGIKYAITPDNTGYVWGNNPKIFYDEKNNTHRVPLKNIEEYKKWLKNNMCYTDSEIEAMLATATYETGDKIEVTYDPSYTSLFKNQNSFKAVTKIATNFYMWKGGTVSNIIEPIKYLNEELDISYKMGYFYPKEKMNYEFDEQVSHILYLRADSSQKLLYCYIELFNCHCFIVPLNLAYEGSDFQKSYIWDLINGKELLKNISLNLSRSEIEKRDYDFFNLQEEEFYERFIQYNQRLGRKIKEKKIFRPNPSAGETEL